MKSVVLVCVMLSVAHAENEQDADRLFLEGRKLLEAGKAGDACGRFEEALRLAPDAPATLLHLGLCNELRGRLKTAIDWFSKAQLRALEREQREIEANARGNLVRLKSRVPTLVVKLARPELRAKVTLDGVPLPASELGRVELDAGDHVLEASVEGYRTVHETFAIQDEAKRELVLRFEPTTVGARPSSRAHLWFGIGGGVALAGGVSLMVYEKYKVYEPARDRFLETFREADREKANRARTIVDFIATPMVIAGGVALGVAGYLWLRRRGEQRVAIVPVGTQGLGIAGHW